MEGGLVLPLLLELLSQLEQALPPPVQHPQLRTGPAVPPIRAFAGRGRISSPPCFFAGATQVERSGSPRTQADSQAVKKIQPLTSTQTETEVPEE